MTVRSLFFCIFIVFPAVTLATEYATPKGRVKDSIEKVISILKSEADDSNKRWEQIASVIRDGFDFRSMSQSVLARNWKRATPEEQERFIEFFSQYIEETYRSKIEAYTDEKIIYGDEVIRGDKAVVETVIVTSSAKIPVNFKLRNNNGNWLAYDVVIEGVSLVSNYRSTFAAIVKNEGMDGLMSDIQRRIDKYKKERAAEDAAAGATGESS